MSGYLLQRGAWFFLGLGFVGLTILKFDRIPNRPCSRCKWIMAFFFLIMGGVWKFFFLFAAGWRPYFSLWATNDQYGGKSND